MLRDPRMLSKREYCEALSRVMRERLSQKVLQRVCYGYLPMLLAEAQIVFTHVLVSMLGSVALAHSKWQVIES